MEYFFTLLIAAGLGLIPANIAKNKGYSFGLWWFYGWMLFIVAIIHVTLIPDKNPKPVPVTVQGTEFNANSTVKEKSAADELKKYKDLLDEGVITEEEFAKKKAQLLELL